MCARNNPRNPLSYLKFLLALHLHHSSITAPQITGDIHHPLKLSLMHLVRVLQSVDFDLLRMNHPRSNPPRQRNRQRNPRHVMGFAVLCNRWERPRDRPSPFAFFDSDSEGSPRRHSRAKIPKNGGPSQHQYPITPTPWYGSGCNTPLTADVYTPTT